MSWYRHVQGHNPYDWKELVFGKTKRCIECSRRLVGVDQYYCTHCLIAVCPECFSNFKIYVTGMRECDGCRYGED